MDGRPFPFEALKGQSNFARTYSAQLSAQYTPAGVVKK